MKTGVLIFMLFCFVWATILPNNSPGVFGVVSIDDFHLYDDQDVEAVVLFDFGKSHFSQGPNGFDVVFERVTRIQILSDAGVDWANIEIPYYQHGSIFERVSNIEAAIYNVNNGLIFKSSIDASNIFDEQINEYWRQKKMALPDVREGSIIEYRYEIRTQHVFRLKDWEFQWKIPVKYSEYEVRMIPFYEYRYILQGATRFHSSRSQPDRRFQRSFSGIEYHDMVHSFVMRDIPAFTDEEFISSINDYIIKMNFQLAKINYPNGSIEQIMTTWPEMINDLLKHPDFGRYINRSRRDASRIIDVKSIIEKPEKERYEYVMNHIKRDFRWNNFNGKFASKSPRNLIRDKHGNCADINLFAIGALKAVGIEADPVIISTRDHGIVNYDYPFSHFFNYVIISAKVDGETILTDAASLMVPNNRIPLKCINFKGLKIANNQEKWVDLTFDEPSEKNINLDLRLSDSGLSIDVVKTATEYEAMKYRVNYGDEKSNIVEQLKSSRFEIDESTIEVKNQFVLDQPWEISFSLQTNPEYLQDRIIISPFLGYVIDDNPLKQDQRTYPIDMIYSARRTYQSTLELPEGYQVELLPDNLNFSNDLFDINYNVQQNGDEITISFSYWFKHSLYPARDYGRLRAYFLEIVRRGNEKIVLTRI